eukprot:374591_1
MNIDQLGIMCENNIVKANVEEFLNQFDIQWKNQLNSTLKTRRKHFSKFYLETPTPTPSIEEAPDSEYTPSNEPLKSKTKEEISSAETSTSPDLTILAQNKVYKEMNKYKNNLLNIINDTDLILGTNENWLFGNWIYSAINIGNITNDSKNWLEWNARNIVTLWGPNGEINNYASKQWNGIIKYYYKPQWELFFNMINNSIENKKQWNQTEFNKKNLNEIEIPFQTNTSHPFQFKIQNNTIDIACKLYVKYNLFGDTQCM